MLKAGEFQEVSLLHVLDHMRMIYQRSHWLPKGFVDIGGPSRRRFPLATQRHSTSLSRDVKESSDGPGTEELFTTTFFWWLSSKKFKTSSIWRVQDNCKQAQVQRLGENSKIQKINSHVSARTHLAESLGF